MERHNDDGANIHARQLPGLASERAVALRLILETRRAVLVRRIRESTRVRQASSTSSGGSSGGERHALRELADDLERDLAKIAANTIQKLDAALDCLAQGRYGDCATCDEPIATSRLALLPFAIRCVKCETSCDHSPRS